MVKPNTMSLRWLPLTRVPRALVICFLTHAPYFCYLFFVLHAGVVFLSSGSKGAVLLVQAQTSAAHWHAKTACLPARA